MTEAVFEPYLLVTIVRGREEDEEDDVVVVVGFDVAVEDILTGDVDVVDVE